MWLCAIVVVFRRKNVKRSATNDTNIQNAFVANEYNVYQLLILALSLAFLFLFILLE